MIWFASKSVEDGDPTIVDQARDLGLRMPMGELPCQVSPAALIESGVPTGNTSSDSALVPFRSSADGNTSLKKITRAGLAAMPASEQKTCLGERLHQMVKKISPAFADQIVGLILEKDNLHLLELLEDPIKLRREVSEAAKGCKAEAVTPQGPPAEVVPDTEGKNPVENKRKGPTLDKVAPKGPPSPRDQESKKVRFSIPASAGQDDCTEDKCSVKAKREVNMSGAVGPGRGTSFGQEHGQAPLYPLPYEVGRRVK